MSWKEFKTIKNQRPTNCNNTIPPQMLEKDGLKWQRRDTKPPPPQPKHKNPSTNPSKKVSQQLPKDDTRMMRKKKEKEKKKKPPPTHQLSKIKITQTPEPISQPTSQPIHFPSAKSSRPHCSHSEETITVEHICNIETLAIRSKLTH